MKPRCQRSGSIIQTRIAGHCNSWHIRCLRSDDPQELEPISARQAQVRHKEVRRSFVVLTNGVIGSRRRTDAGAGRFERFPKHRQRVFLVVDEQYIDLIEAYLSGGR